MQFCGKEYDRRPLRGARDDLESLRRQPPLTETTDELCSVARAQGVGRPDTVHLGANATEARVKALSADGSLARTRGGHFATHGLLPRETAAAREPYHFWPAPA